MSFKNPFFAPLLAVALCAAVAPRALAQKDAGPRIIIDSSPPGASVYLDGKERGMQGYSSSTFKVRVSKGPHRVLLELEGYKPVEQIVNVTQAQKFTFTLERAPARLEVKSPGTNQSARDGEVFVDGAPAGTVPVPVEVPSGRHLVEVRKPGHAIFSETVELRAGETRALWVTLRSEVKGGTLVIAADAANADVFVDGAPKGQAPAVVDNLAEGDHLVEVRRPEPDAKPWRQTVRVVAGQQTRVTATTQAAGGGTGSLMVLTSTSDAEVIVDNSVHGRANQEIANLKPGQHYIEVRAKGYGTANRTVEVEPGKQRVERIELPQSAEGRGIGVLRLIMVNPVEGAQYYINGRKYDENAILSEKGVEVASGQTIVVVRKDGFGEARKELSVRPGGVETVSVDLRNVGRIQIMSDPRGAQVMLDKMLVGQTPYVAEDVPAGEHLVEMNFGPQFQHYVERVVVRGGQQYNINAQPVPGTASGPETENKRRGLSSFSALAMDQGNFTTDFGVGYPYFLQLRLTVGIIKKANFGIDAGLTLRTTFYETDINAHGRMQLFKFGPIAGGVSMLIGGGGGPRKRNGFVFELGVPITLLAGNYVRVTGKPYLQVYSDRLCPSIGDITELANRKDAQGIFSLSQNEHVGDRCTGGGEVAADGSLTMPRYPNSVLDAAGYTRTPDGKGVMPTGLPPSYNPDYTAPDGSQPYRDRNGTPVLDRFEGVRFMLQAAVEVAISSNGSVWFLIEGAPFQPPRPSYTDRFNRVFPENDFPLYGQVGYTLKF